MVEIYPNLFVGSQRDYDSDPLFFKNWRVVHACKEPYHRKALGYTGRGAPKDSPYYYFLFDDNNHLIMNIVDTESPDYFNETMVATAIKYCIDGINNGQKVLIHCNLGESRAPSIALLLLRKMGVYKCSFDEALIDFKNKYNLYSPKNGILTYVKNHW